MTGYPAELVLFAAVGLFVSCWLAMATAIWANLQLLAWWNRHRARTTARRIR